MVVLRLVVYAGNVPDVMVTVPGTTDGETISTTEVGIPLTIVAKVVV